MASQHNRQDNRMSDLAVMDADEFKNKRRLERILDAMDGIDDTVRNSKAELAAGEIDYHGRRVVVQGAVKSAIWESWNLLLRHDKKCQQEAEGNGDDWGRSEYFIGHEDRGPVGVVPQQHHDDIVFWGLRDFYLFEKDIWIEQWSETVKERNREPEVVEHEVRHSVPVEVSMAAALRLKEFLETEHDLEIQFQALDESRPYDDWRKEFETGVYHGPNTVDLPHKNV